MVIQIKINPELIEWVCQQTGMDSAEAEEFVKHFAGMLYLTGAFEAIEVAQAGGGWGVRVGEFSRLESEGK